MTNPSLVILKFGGTSVQDAKAISSLVEIVRAKRGHRLLVVVSALAKVTDTLLAISRACEAGDAATARRVSIELLEQHLAVGRELDLTLESLEPIETWLKELEAIAGALATMREVSPRSRDRLAAYGELCSSRLVHGALRAAGFDAEWIDSREFIATDAEFGSAAVDFDATTRACREGLRPRLERTGLAVAQGFIGATPGGLTTTLGRGGSDYSAAIFGAALSAAKVEIWTDVDGILSTDPRVVPEAKILAQVHFEEASEMAFFGAKVLHPATIRPALKERIPVWILNSKNPSTPGTEITFGDDGREALIRGIAFKKNVTLVDIHSTRMMGAHGFLKSVFDVFAKYRLSVDLIATSEVNISLTLDPNSDLGALDQAQRELAGFSEVAIHGGRAIVSVVGRGIRRTPGLAARIFGVLTDINVQMISMGASELNLSFVIDSAQADEAVRRLHRALI